MFFDPLRFEQATSEGLARYKASLGPAGPIADLCCGMGGDLLGLARHHTVTGVDFDPGCCLFAQANAGVNQLPRVTIQCADACHFPVGKFSAWHIDPDRRPAKKRTIDVAAHQPPLSALELLLQANPHGAIKLAPAASPPEPWMERAELCWLGEQRECKQLFVCFGDWATSPGSRSAILVAEHGEQLGRWVGEADAIATLCEHPSEFVFEPHAAIRAAGLAGAVACQRGWQQLASGIRYFTGPAACREPGIRCCRRIEQLAYDRKRVKAALAARRLGRLEIKTHHSGLDPAMEQRRLKVAGDERATLFIYPRNDRLQCLITEDVA